VEYWVKDKYSDISPVQFIIPGLTKLAPGESIILNRLVPCFHRDKSGFLLEFTLYLIRGRNDVFFCE
jgi:hypothetical protein